MNPSSRLQSADDTVSELGDDNHSYSTTGIRGNHHNDDNTTSSRRKVNDDDNDNDLGRKQNL
jgi:hypothetical protein